MFIEVTFEDWFSCSGLLCYNAGRVHYTSIRSDPLSPPQKHLNLLDKSGLNPRSESSEDSSIHLATGHAGSDQTPPRTGECREWTGMDRSGLIQAGREGIENRHRAIYFTASINQERPASMEIY